MGVVESPAAATSLEVAPEPGQRSTNCLNCGGVLAGPFCSACGQRDIPPYPSVRELVVDAFWELSGWDGRFVATVRELIRHPGKLTREFLEGRRARYLSPLRLYLMASLAYFLVAALSSKNSGVNGIVTVTESDTKTNAPAQGSAPARVAVAVSSAVRGNPPDSAKLAQAMRDIAKSPVIMRPFLRRLVVDPKGFQRGLVDAIPRLLFALVPVFAAILALFYRRRKYPEHLYFAIHLHSFVFLAMLAVALVRLTGLKQVASAAGLIVFVWIITYATISLRRLYGGSLGLTLAKQVGIGALYMFASITALLATIYAVALWA